jgi:hypothetical protein
MMGIVTDRLDKLRRLAYRYGGQVVLSIVNRRAFVSASVSLAGAPSGSLELRPLSLRNPRSGRLDRNKVERELVIEMGGPIAERIARGSGSYEWHGTGRDVLSSDRAIAFASELSDSHEATRAYLKYIWLRARDTLIEPDNWAAVQMVAADLLDRQTVTARRARELYRQTIETMHPNA